MQPRFLGLTLRLSVAILLIVSVFSARAMAEVSNDFYASGSISLQLFRDGTAVSDVAMNNVSNFLSIHDNGSQVTFGTTMYVPVGRPITFLEFTPSPNGLAAYALPYLNPSNPSDPLNNTVVDLQNLGVALTGTVPTTGTAFNTAGLTFAFAGGTFNMAGPTAINLAGDNGSIANVPDGSSILGTYTIPVNVDIPISTPFGNIDAVFTGNITAVSLPEPGAVTLVAVGLLALVPMLRCRRRSVQ